MLWLAGRPIWSDAKSSQNFNAESAFSLETTDMCHVVCCVPELGSVTPLQEPSQPRSPTAVQKYTPEHGEEPNIFVEHWRV